MSRKARTPEPVFAVIVPHYNDVVRLGRCLERLMPQVDAETEVLVVDNDSTVDLGPVKAAYPQVRFLTEPQKGAAMARNRGVAETSVPAFAFIDADCVPAPDWLARARAMAVENQVTGGRVDVFHETPPPRTGAEAFEQVFAFRQEDYIRRKGFTGTGNLVTTRAVFDATGPLVPGLSEDMDWSRRAVVGGAALVYDDKLVVGHPSRQDWAALQRKWRRTTAEMFALNGLGLAARLKWAARALAMVPSALVHAPQIVVHKGLNRGEKGRALAVLFGLRTQRALWMLRQALTGRL